jgi:hypothetical protein
MKSNSTFSTGAWVAPDTARFPLDRCVDAEWISPFEKTNPFVAGWCGQEGVAAIGFELLSEIISLAWWLVPL